MSKSNLLLQITNATLDEQYIDPDDGREQMEIDIPARTRNVLVQLHDINYKVTRITLIRSGKPYYFANNGGSAVYKC